MTVHSSIMLWFLNMPHSLLIVTALALTDLCYVPMQAASAGEMDRAARLCTVFNQFCDYNINLVGSTSQMVIFKALVMQLCLCMRQACSTLAATPGTLAVRLIHGKPATA